MSAAVECDYTIEGAGPPLFLVHGVGATRDAWRLVTPALRGRLTVVAHDLRGHGTSPRPDPEFGLDDLVDDLEAVRERTGLEAGHFAGHSLGAMVVAAYARRHPGRVRSLGLLSTAAGRTAEDAAKVRAVLQEMEGRGVAAAMRTLSGRWFTDEFRASRPDVVGQRMREALGTDPGALLNAFRVYAETEMGPWLPEVAARTLVLTGENDGGCNPRLNRFIADALPDAELVILPRVRHATLLEAPGQVADNLARFFAG